AAHSLGIPHPPGTPLFVILLNVWAHAFWFLPYPVSTNLLSAVCTAGAIGLLTAWLARALHAEPAGSWLALAGGIACGAMTSIWMNATETEVYAASLLLVAATLSAADVAGRSGSVRWRLLTVYLIALAVPLHLSALVAAPAVIALATERSDGRFDWETALALSGIFVMTAGVGRVSVVTIAIGVLMVVLSAFIRRSRPWPLARCVGAMLVAAVAFSATAFMFLRARHDPAINQGNPDTFARLAAVIGRQQYDVAGIWPRRAPAWLQISNWFEYADWQVALSLAPTVIPTIWRALATLSFAALAVVGALWHRRLDRRSWRAAMVLLVSGSLGVIAYLNLKAGSSFAWRFVSDPAAHEARDRDYFFVLGFAAWGLWAGMGAVRLARRLRLHPLVGVCVAAVPIALNWSAVSRRAEPESQLPGFVARALLDGLPPRAVLFVAGDNDTYPLWYSQEVEHRRRDVIVVTIPLLAAPWYSRELERRYGFASSRGVFDVVEIAASVARSVERSGRPLAAALTVEKADRARLSRFWTDRGFYLLAGDSSSRSGNGFSSISMVITVDSSAVAAARDSAETWLGRRIPRPSVDPVDEYMASVLNCPRLVLEKSPGAAQLVSLDSTCNLR
ncbi:MAG TPA: DUF2723 domain-containing protein, partial [Gemmatimonadaceae bacterium]|nr:DUF2723 domain-containing protein [Gemmatimonadaceae bacterium]